MCIIEMKSFDVIVLLVRLCYCLFLCTRSVGLTYSMAYPGTRYKKDCQSNFGLFSSVNLVG